MTTPNRTPKDAQDHIPFCADQGIPNLVGTPKKGFGAQSFRVTVPGAAVTYTLVFETEGGMDMADAAYRVEITNHTTQGTGIAPLADRTAKQLILRSVAAADVLEVLVTGTLKGQLVD